MKPLRLALALAAFGCFAGHAALAQDLTGLWKSTTMNRPGQREPMGEAVQHPIFCLEVRDGRLTGVERVMGAHYMEEEHPLASARMRGNAISFEVYDDNTGNYRSYQGVLMGEAIFGKMTSRFRIPREGIEEEEHTWVASRINPEGIWDMSLKDPLETVKDDLIKFSYKDLALSGTWLRDVDAASGKRRPLALGKVNFTAAGISFTVADTRPEGKVTYDFEGEFVGALRDDAFGGQTRLVIGPKGLQVNDPGSTLEMMMGTVRITGPDGKLYAAKWKATRDNGKRARVEMGRPYEVK